MKINTILDQIDLGSMALPEFQRGYVWNREQVRRFMNSLYRRYPVGSLLVWVTKTENAPARGDGPLTPGSVELILDGQQRITSLYGIVRGKPPKFFDGNEKTFTGLYFNLEDESFIFYMPTKMKDNPLWINVTELMQAGVGKFILGNVLNNPEMKNKAELYIERLNGIDGIKNIELHIEKVTGEDKTVDVVVEIFNEVNSGGTKLSKGDLALAKICAELPKARNEMKKRLGKWRNAGFNFKLELLLRVINSIITGEALFTALKDVDPATFMGGLEKAEKSMDYLLNLISSRLGLDHDRVLGSRYSFPLMARYLDQRGEKLSDHQERDKLLYWYIHTFLWGRYAGSTESTLNQDLAVLEEREGALDRLIAGLRRDRGDLNVQPGDFMGWSRGARFYPLLYMMTRVFHAKDWETGVELKDHLLGKLASLELHHVFPRDFLYRHGYSKADVNALANFTFLTKDTNLKVSNKDPAKYLPDFVTRQAGAIESHWIPMDPELWKVENYLDFLAARRELLANAANKFLDSLLSGTVAETEAAPSVFEREQPVTVLGSVDTAEEEQKILECKEWVLEQSLPEGEFGFELTDAESGELLALLDLAWPDGLQEGYSKPVALLIDEPPEVHDVVNRAGYLFFTSSEEFKEYVRREILATEVEVIAD